MKDAVLYGKWTKTVWEDLYYYCPRLEIDLNAAVGTLLLLLAYA